MVTVAEPGLILTQPSPYRALGRRLRELRKQHGLTQDEVARRTGYSMSYISTLELGRSQPSTTTIDRYVAELGADKNELSRLAGYLKEADPSAWTPPPDKAPLLREISEEPYSLIEQALAFIRTVKRGVNMDADRAREIRRQDEGASQAC